MTDNTAMSNADLEPCPFCGSIPSVLSHSGTGKYFVSCRNVDCMTVDTDFCASFDDAVTDWNGRLNKVGNRGAIKMLRRERDDLVGALTAISRMHVDDSTDFRSLVALCMGIAKSSLTMPSRTMDAVN